MTCDVTIYLKGTNYHYYVKNIIHCTEVIFIEALCPRILQQGEKIL